MAVTDAYAKDTDYKAMIGKTVGDDDTQIQSQLLAVSRYLDRRLGRFFTKDDVAVARKFYAGVDYQRTLFVDDISSSSGLIVKVDDNRDGTAETTLTITTDFELAPMRAGLGPEPAPYTQLYLPPRVSRAYWVELVEITAKWGWPAVPQAIVQATCQLVGILRLDTPRATSRISEGLDTVIGASSQAQRIVDELSAVYAKPAWVFA